MFKSGRKLVYLIGWPTDRFGAKRKPSNTTKTVQMSAPKVSIIIPTYNYEVYIKDAIESALAQDYDPKEVIVVDDGSTDDTGKVVEAFESVRYIYQENAGVSAARNRGAKEATGEFLVFLDADDMMDSGMISHILPKLIQELSIAIVACRARSVTAQGEPLPENSLNDKFVGELTSRHFLMSNHFPTGGAVIRKSAFEACKGFDESLVSTEDRDLWYRIAVENTVILLKERLFTVRAHSDSLSMNADRAARHMDAFIQKSQASEAGKRETASFWAAVKAYRDCQTAWTLNAEKKRGPAIKLMLRSIICCPFFPRKYVPERKFFRLRALRIFILRALSS